jgi:hypothetical protein
MLLGHFLYGCETPRAGAREENVDVSFLLFHRFVEAIEVG